MLEPATPQHGFLAVQLAVSVYVVAVVCIVLGLRGLGLAADATGVTFVAVSAALLVPFWPVFRRLHPERPE